MHIAVTQQFVDDNCQKQLECFFHKSASIVHLLMDQFTFIPPENRSHFVDTYHKLRLGAWVVLLLDSVSEKDKLRPQERGLARLQKPKQCCHQAQRCPLLICLYKTWVYNKQRGSSPAGPDRLFSPFCLLPRQATWGKVGSRQVRRSPFSVSLTLKEHTGLVNPAEEKLLDHHHHGHREQERVRLLDAARGGGPDQRLLHRALQHSPQSFCLRRRGLWRAGIGYSLSTNTESRYFYPDT